MLARLYFLLFLIAFTASCKPINFNEQWGCKQIIVVKTAHKDSIQGHLKAYNWSDEKQEWVAASEEIPMVVGYKGLAWGAGLHEEKFNEQPFKKEGDRRSPIGLFYLSAFFGYNEPQQLGTLKMPYIKADNSIFCVDDPLSKYYNRIVDIDKVQKDWTSAEHMLLDNDFYKYGVVIDYNAPKTEAGKGSCIFLHIWRNAKEGTFGCTAVEENAMKNILSWLDISQKPILVQAPEEEYNALKKRYFLP
jgi:L,D-peptidoglycan transpeptidase YkuD (ErfK/YbiS/YcfS/YnhG family)